MKRKLPQLAKKFWYSKETINWNLMENGIKLRDKYSDLSDVDLKNRIEEIEETLSWILEKLLLILI